MKPTVTLQLDKTPPMSEEEEENDSTPAPTGDLAELSQNVGLVIVPSQGSTSAQGNAPVKKTNKNKGVGKGCSGSSGPPLKRRRPANNLIQQPAREVDSDEEDVEVDEHAEPGSTQHITVGVRRGYSVYPGYLFDVPPKRIKIDHLRKQFMIHEIARARAER